MKIYSLIPKIMADVGFIGKNKKNSAQGYNFRGIDDVYQAMHPALVKHGVFYTPKVIGQQREERATKAGGTMMYTILTVEYTFFADDGSNISLVTVGEAMDSGDKSANKAMSAALKYAIMQLFCIPTEEDKNMDTEMHSPEFAASSYKPGTPNKAQQFNSKVAASLPPVQQGAPIASKKDFF